jgi:hypothetical protein
MAILAGIGMYLVAMVCLCALVGASRKKQERCLREMKRAVLTGEAVSPTSENLVGVRLQQARRAPRHPARNAV